VDLQIVELLLM